MSGESSYPSAIRGDGGANPSASSNNSSAQAAPAKRKRNLPGTPDPEAEVIALSPKTLMATNRFVCEICNKGFQRDQNLQLHRRGHNLPWKLRQRTTKEIKKRVYICPEENCVHHDPSRALGDLTGIKKHYCRKHGEKKWKCDKCSKRYAVQSDWKAHSKTCGTREYRCDCGTLFSRRDSFITHRAFCDALAEESARVTGGIVGGPPQMPLGMPGANAVAIANHVMGVGVGGGAQSSPPRSNLMRLGASTQSDQFGFRQNFGSANTAFNPARPGGLSLWFGQGADQQNLNMNPMDFSQSPKPLMGGGASTEYEDPTKINPSNLYPSMFASNDGGYGWNTQGAENRVANSTTQQQQQKPLSLSTSAGHTTSATNDANSNLNNGGCYSSQSAQMSATALLQKAAQMGATASNSAFRGFSVPVSNSSSMGLGLTWQNTQGNSHNNGQYVKSPLEQQVIADYVRGGENNNGLNDLMNSLSANGMLPLSGLNAYMDNDPCHNNAEGGFTGLGVISNRGNVNAMKEQSFQQQQTRAGLSPSPSLSSSSSMSQQQQQQQNHMMLSGAGSTHQNAVTLLSGMGNPTRNGEDGAEGLTRDFLGVGAMQPRAFHHHQMGNAFSHLGVGGSGMDSIAASFNPPHGGDDLKPWETAT